ncbi:hypothetical protein ColTof4_02341 [Colletotrichum tofieldiae]|nr:hypothetical protein ColTof3_09370 [Colletotrichum tofieldiae]GKT69918.1 hypothetical protein ColTof4_02341 [Colletotrichum tofieldiae]GKT92936.1 hypothetical protein Ct61P_10786 [Colletotrichum tofieldiae]
MTWRNTTHAAQKMRNTPPKQPRATPNCALSSMWYMDGERRLIRERERGSWTGSEGEAGFGAAYRFS